jgi:hypothetical protein
MLLNPGNGRKRLAFFCGKKSRTGAQRVSGIFSPGSERYFPQGLLFFSQSAPAMLLQNEPAFVSGRKSRANA